MVPEQISSLLTKAARTSALKSSSFTSDAPECVEVRPEVRKLFVYQSRQLLKREVRVRMICPPASLTGKLDTGGFQRLAHGVEPVGNRHHALVFVVGHDEDGNAGGVGQLVARPFQALARLTALLGGQPAASGSRPSFSTARNSSLSGGPIRKGRARRSARCCSATIGMTAS